MKRAHLAVLAVLLATSAAHADVGVVVTGEATLQPQLASQAEGWLKQRGHTVFASPLEPDAINTIIDCFVIEDLNCARTLIEKRAKSATIVYLRIELAPETDGSRNISIVGYWMQKGHEIIGERRNCHHCSETDLHTATDDLMHVLAADPPSSTHVPTPEDAAKAVTAPPADKPMVDDTQPSHLVPGIVIGAGVAFAITGAILIGIDKDQSDIPKTGPQPADFRDTATGGVICVGIGAAAIATGVVLWFHQGGSSAPVASVSHDAAVVGWSGRF